MPVHGTDREILETTVGWLAGGHTIALVTVARTWGSSPRPPGSLMVMRGDGVFCGSVSGGCVEEDLVQRYREHQLGGPFPTLVDYGINREEATRLGLPCGGRLELLVEQPDSAAPLELLLGKIQSGELVARRVCLNTGEVSLHAAKASDEFAYGDDSLSRVFGMGWRLLIIGDGHTGRYLARIALMLDYQVIICDPRDEYEPDQDNKACERVYLMPDEAVQAYADHSRCVVLALTHDPKLDDMAILEALESPAFYVGAIGSRTNSESRRKRLVSMGLDDRHIERLHAPVGLPIGSYTPPEIALSIMAEITALRNRAEQAARSAASAA